MWSHVDYSVQLSGLPLHTGRKDGPKVVPAIPNLYLSGIAAVSQNILTARVIIVSKK